MYEIIKNKKGFIAALDQSGGSSSKTLKAYGISEDKFPFPGLRQRQHELGQ